MFGGRFLNITGVLKAESSFEFRSIFVIVDIINFMVVSSYLKAGCRGGRPVNLYAVH